VTVTLSDADSVDRPEPIGSNDGPRADLSRRRTFTAEHKTRILAEYDAAPRGERGAILRREGL
jgi:transposase